MSNEKEYEHDIIRNNKIQNIADSLRNFVLTN